MKQCDTFGKTWRILNRQAGAVLVIVGLMIPLPLSVVSAGQIPEEEANNTIISSTPIGVLESGFGNISFNVADVDIWMASGAFPGDLIFVYVDATGSRGRMLSEDSTLVVRANDGFTVIESDDLDGPGSSSVVAGAVVPMFGNVFYAVREDGNSANIEPYFLYQVIVDPGDVSGEVEPNNTAANATPISQPITSGVFQTGGPLDIDMFSFPAKALESIVVIMDDDPDNDGIHTDTELAIISTDGTTVIAGGDNRLEGNGNAAGGVNVPTDGTYYVRVVDGGDADIEYRFVVMVNGETVGLDSDGDGAPDTSDDCPNDPGKIDPGTCGCGTSDTDSDGDQTPDCADGCPDNPNATSAFDLACCGPVSAPTGFAMMMNLGIVRLYRRRTNRITRCRSRSRPGLNE